MPSSIAAKALSAGALVLLLAGCASAPAADDSPASTPTPGAVAASSCVVDPNAVISRTDPLPTTALPGEVAAAIDDASRTGLKEISSPGIIVAVQSPAGLFTQAYGIADPATSAPMTTDMHQRVGSINKTFTGTLLMQLVADGLLTLDDPISDYVDGVTDGDQVTLRMLADMSSGVSSYTRNETFVDTLFAEPDAVWTPQQLLDLGLGMPRQDFAPGEGFDYSNTNTILLGVVIEQVTGQTYAEVLDERILAPLNLSGTSFPGDSPAFPEPHPQGFTLQGDWGTPDAPGNATDWNPSWAWSAGEIISTASDLLTYARAQGTGAGLLSEDLQIERLTSFPGSAGYGIGWGCQDGWAGHAGELPGYNSSMFYETTSDTTVIVLANSDIPSGDCGDQATVTGNDTSLPCRSPATRVFVHIADALGLPFTPPGG